MKLLELVMIVKNSGSILEKCLTMNKKWIDHWTILDTGSTDNTKEIIQKSLEGIPGTLYSEEFIDFSQARNRALDLCSKTCKFAIMLDDSYVIHGGDKLREILKKDKRTSCFMIKIGKQTDGFLHDDYYSKRITRVADKLRYKYRVHEDIVVSENKLKCMPDDIFLEDLTFKDHTKRSFNRYKKDIEMLSLDLADNPYEQRVIYYLAKTHHIMEEYDKSLEYYARLKSLKNVREDFLFAAHYDGACIAYAVDNDLKKFKSSLEFVKEIFPERVEPVYKLAIIHKDAGDITKAESLINTIIGAQKPMFLGTLLETEIYDYYIGYIYIDIGMALGNVHKVVPLLKHMLRRYQFDQPLLNIKYAVSKGEETSIELSDGRTVVIHTGCSDIIYCWNPQGDKRISGWEYMAMNLGREFVNRGYRVLIIGTFNDTEKGVNYEGIYNDIEYIDYKYFNEFALKYVIDYLIVSRYTANLVYYDNIKRVYLWIHDVLPLVTENSKFVQFHKTKFKSIVAISEWQKQNTVDKLNIDPAYITVSRNAIHLDRFNSEQALSVTKIPFRFIYSSCAERGLDCLIDIIPRVKERYPETTLHVFVLRERVNDDTFEKMKKLDYVLLNDRITQEQLAIEFLKSDVWLYPTNFPETYCITALEAMVAKCLVVTVDYCGLGNVVKGKGVVCDPPVADNIEDLLDKMFFTLDKPMLKNHFIDKAYAWATQQTYDRLAEEWISNILK